MNRHHLRHFAFYCCFFRVRNRCSSLSGVKTSPHNASSRVVDAPAGEDDLGVIANGDGFVGEFSRLGAKYKVVEALIYL